MKRQLLPACETCSHISWLLLLLLLLLLLSDASL
jgi:hypothetical protein